MGERLVAESGLEVELGRGTGVDPGAMAIDVTLVPSRVLRSLVGIIVVLVGLSTAGQAVVHYGPDFPLRDPAANLFYVDFERSLPTLYSSVMLLVAGLLFAVIARAHRREDRPSSRHWAALALVFFILGIDEFAALHELLSGPLRALLDIEGGPLQFAWVIPAGVVVAAFVAAFARFLVRLPDPFRRRLVVAGLLYVGGALGVELIGGWYSSLHGDSNLSFALISTVEEALEMVGSAVLISALLAYIAVGLPGLAWRLRIAAPHDANASRTPETSGGAIPRWGLTRPPPATRRAATRGTRPRAGGP
jgi:hypothetical protein